jgi:hypothetical protein
MKQLPFFGVGVILLQLFLFTYFYNTAPSSSEYSLIQFYLIFAIFPFAMSDIRERIFKIPFRMGLIHFISSFSLTFFLLQTLSSILPNNNTTWSLSVFLFAVEICIIAFLENAVFIDWLPRYVPNMWIVAAIATSFHMSALFFAGYLDVVVAVFVYVYFIAFQIITKRFGFMSGVGAHSGLNVFLRAGVPK